MAEKSIFPVGDHFPRPYDANFLRPRNGRKIDFSGGGPLFGVLTMLIFQGWEMADKSFFTVGDNFPRPYNAKWLRPRNGRKINFSCAGPLSETLRC